MKKKKTMGMFVCRVSDRYHSPMWPAVLDVAKHNGMNLLIFSGQSINDPVGFISQENIVYELAGQENIDGLLFVAGSVCNYLDDAETQQFIGRFRDVPVVSVARVIEGIPSVIVSNYQGMYDEVSHMITVHGRKKIAFIRGPVQNPEAEIRFQAYRDALQKHGLHYDDRLVAQGAFAGFTGAEGVTDLLDRRKAEFDCLVSANDDMLLWAKDVLLKRNIRIPRDVSIGGFDNINESQYSDPPLTTVSQPEALVAGRGAEILVDLMNGKACNQAEIQVPAELILRKSCGCGESPVCFDSVEYQEAPEPESRPHASATALLLDRAKDISQAVQAAYPSLEHQKTESEKFVRRVIEVFADDLDNRRRNPKLASVIGELTENVTDIETANLRCRMLGRIKTLIRQNIGASSVAQAYVDYAFQTAQQAVSRRLADLANILNGKLMTILWALKRMTQNLSGTFEMEKNKQILVEEFPVVNINVCTIALYEKSFEKPVQTRASVPEKSRLIFRYNRYRNASQDAEPDETFATRQLAPFDLFDPEAVHCMGVFPLMFENLHFGYLCIDILPDNYDLMRDSLREHMSSALKGSFLVQELKRAQSQLIEIAEVAMEANYHKSKVLVNMSHELRTPLNSINGITSLLQVGGFEGVEEISQYLVDIMDYILKQDPPDDGLRRMLEELKSFQDILDKTGSTSAFYFLHIRQWLKDRYGGKHAPVLETLDQILKFLEDKKRDTQTAYDNIREAGQYLLGLIEMVLNLSKVETGKTELNANLTPVRPLVLSVVQDAQYYCKSKNKDHHIRIEYDVQRHVPENVMMDKQKIKEVLLNLVTNAVKYTEKGWIRIAVRVEGDFLKFSVQDTGFGVRKEDRDKVFMEFGRTADAKGIEGTGLGLPLVRKLVKIHGGQVDFESEHGKGSTFWFTLPIRLR